MPGCAAMGCNNRSEKGYMMKCFPRDPVLRQIWKERVGRTDWQPSNNSFLCHMHFESNQWVVSDSGRVKLKKGALPTVFMVTTNRKSSKKRNFSESEYGENADDYLIEYLQNDNTSPLETPEQEQIVVRPISDQSPPLKNVNNDSVYFTHNQMDELDKILNADTKVDCDELKQPDAGNSNVNIISTEIKKEVEERLSNDDYMQIEKRLKLVCDGEKYEDLINKPNSSSELSEEDECKNENTDFVPNQETSKINNVSNNDYIVPATKESSNFTIRISGEPEDVYEITQSLDPTTNGIKCQSDEDGSKFITSQIVVNYPKINTADLDEDQESMQSDEMSDPRQESFSCDFAFVNELLQKHKDLEAKAEIQQQVINTLSEQSIQHKDLVESMKLMEKEIKRKVEKIEQLERKINIKKDSSIQKKCDMKTHARTEVDEPLLFKITNRINQLETTNKQLMKSLNIEVEKRRKADYQVRDRENKIKELKWKLNKASKFYERSEKNTNTYRRKLSTLQTLLRRKNLMDDKKQTYEEMLSERSDDLFSKRSMTAALSILKSCGNRGYNKLLSYNFPLPPMNMLLHKNQDGTSNDADLEDTNVQAEVIDNKSEELASGTVQDIFNESSDGDDMDINEFKKYVLTDDNPS